MEGKKTAYVNFENSKSLKNLFVDDFDIKRNVSTIGFETGVQIDAGDTLTILDEIQEADEGITEKDRKLVKHYHYVGGMQYQPN